MNKPTVLITGSNRGLGLKFAELYSLKNYNVIATCRDPDNASNLIKLTDQSDSITIQSLDVGKSEQIKNLASTLDSTPIDILINNAGIWRSSSLGSADKQAWLESFAINSIAPYELTHALLPSLNKGNQKKVVSITSKMGSIDDNTSGSSYIYRSSKSALNMVMRSLEHDLQSHDIATLTLHPGWVQTDMGGMNALIDDMQSVSGMIEVIDSLNIKNTGRFIDYSGKKINW